MRAATNASGDFLGAFALIGESLERPELVGGVHRQSHHIFGKVEGMVTAPRWRNCRRVRMLFRIRKNSLKVCITSAISDAKSILETGRYWLYLAGGVSDEAEY